MLGWYDMFYWSKAGLHLSFRSSLLRVSSFLKKRDKVRLDHVFRSPEIDTILVPFGKHLSPTPYSAFAVKDSLLQRSRIMLSLPPDKVSSIPLAPAEETVSFELPSELMDIQPRNENEVTIGYHGCRISDALSIHRGVRQLLYVTGMQDIAIAHAQKGGVVLQLCVKKMYSSESLFMNDVRTGASYITEESAKRAALRICAVRIIDWYVHEKGYSCWSIPGSWE